MGEIVRVKNNLCYFRNYPNIRFCYDLRIHKELPCVIKLIHEINEILIDKIIISEKCYSNTCASFSLSNNVLFTYGETLSLFNGGRIIEIKNINDFVQSCPDLITSGDIKIALK
jgi:hypothetical protein